MFNIGSSELLVIAVLLLIVVGPRHLPEITHTLAKITRFLRDSLHDVKETFGTEKLSEINDEFLDEQ